MFDTKRLLIMALGMIGIIMACNKDSDSSIPDTTSYLNVFIANPDESYDVVMDTTAMASGLKLGEYSGYKGFTAKRYTLYIYPAGRRDKILIGGQLSLRNAHYYSVFFSRNRYGILQLLLTEDMLDSSNIGEGRLRVVNLSDTYKTTTSPLTLDFVLDTNIQFQRIGYLAATGFKNFPVGTYKPDIRYADSSLSLLSGTVDSFVVNARKNYSWIVYGNALKSDSFKLVEFVH